MVGFSGLGLIFQIIILFIAVTVWKFPLGPTLFLCTLTLLQSLLFIMMINLKLNFMEVK